MKQRIVNALTGEWVDTEVSEIELPEIPAPTPEELREQYERSVLQRIRSRYSSSQELAILRQKEEKPDEWQDYYDFCEQCKQEVRTELYGQS